MWCDDPANLASLARWLGEQGITATWNPDDWLRFLEKGHHWNPQWKDLQAELLEDRVAA